MLKTNVRNKIFNFSRYFTFALIHRILFKKKRYKLYLFCLICKLGSNTNTIHETVIINNGTYKLDTQCRVVGTSHCFN